MAVAPQPTLGGKPKRKFNPVAPKVATRKKPRTMSPTELLPRSMSPTKPLPRSSATTHDESQDALTVLFYRFGFVHFGNISDAWHAFHKSGNKYIADGVRLKACKYQNKTVARYENPNNLPVPDEYIAPLPLPAGLGQPKRLTNFSARVPVAHHDQVRSVQETTASSSSVTRHELSPVPSTFPKRSAMDAFGQPANDDISMMSATSTASDDTSASVTNKRRCISYHIATEEDGRTTIVFKNVDAS